MSTASLEHTFVLNPRFHHALPRNPTPLISCLQNHRMPTKTIQTFPGKKPKPKRKSFPLSYLCRHKLLPRLPPLVVAESRKRVLKPVQRETRRRNEGSVRARVVLLQRRQRTEHVATARALIIKMKNI